MSEYYNAFGPYIRKRFGQNVYKVNVDAGFTCPNRDGSIAYGGCIYCNNDSFRPGAISASVTVSSQIKNGIAYLSKRYGAERFIAYFQPFTNTYAPVERLEELYDEALANPQVIGLAIGTRPDAIDPEKITLLNRLAGRWFILVEFGLQSIYDETLDYINRGHDYGCFVDALNLCKGTDITVGAHLIAGFPTETIEQMLAMTDEISRMPINFLKIHQLQVIKDTRLAAIYRKEQFWTFGYTEYLDFLVRFIERLRPDIVLQRLFATAPEGILIAPVWDATRQQIIRDIDRRFREAGTYQGKRYKWL